MIAAAWRTIIHRISGDAFVDFVGKNEGLNIGRAGIAPRARIQGPHGAGSSAVISGGSVRTDVELATVVALPEPIAHRVDAGKEAVTAHTHLPLDWAGRAARKSHRARPVILRTAVGLRRRRRSEVCADVAGVELDCVKSVIHVEPISI